MPEFGLFNDEGCVDRGFFTFEAAHEAMVSEYDLDDRLEVVALCAEHDEEPTAFCSECD